MYGLLGKVRGGPKFPLDDRFGLAGGCGSSAKIGPKASATSSIRITADGVSRGLYEPTSRPPAPIGLPFNYDACATEMSRPNNLRRRGSEWEMEETRTPYVYDA